MSEKHYKSMLSAFVNRELGQSELEEIGRHLMQCVDCRAEHDRVKLGAGLAAMLGQYEAPRRIWNRIDAELGETGGPGLVLIPDRTYFGPRNFATYAVGLILFVAIAGAGYVALFRPQPLQEVRRQAPVPGQQVQTVPDVAVVTTEPPANSEQAVAAASPDANTQIAAATVPEASWDFETIAGAPQVDSATADRIAVGQVLETDARSRARITVADIGNVEVAPNSRVRFVGTSDKQHRLSLERGGLHARIAAPPRLFIVDTPSAMAVDLGCEYTLDVDKAGNGTLKVLTGFVALEREGRESIVPAGVSCLTMKGKGLGTPFGSDAKQSFRKALERFDFGGGGSQAVRAILENRSYYDIISLWHLLSRVRSVDRPAIFDALAGYVKPSAGVTREGIMRLDKKMLADWREDVEAAWFNGL